MLTPSFRMGSLLFYVPRRRYVTAPNSDTTAHTSALVLTGTAAPVSDEEVAAADSVLSAPTSAAVVVGSIEVCAGGSVTTDAISVGGIAVPTPVPVHCGGIDSVAVLGFPSGFVEYISPFSPLGLVYSPVSKFAWPPSVSLYSPVVKEPHDPSTFPY
jgi:hypothetical protein